MLNLEIAKLAEVSPSTVSRVINGRPGVSKSVVEHVRDVIEKKGIDYSEMTKRRVRRARPFVKSRTVAVLVLSNDIFHSQSSGFIQLLSSIEKSLCEQNMNMVFSHSSSPDELPPIVKRGNVEGLILSGLYPESSVLEEIKHVPAIWISSHYKEGHTVVSSGNELIGKIAAQYLIDRGHKRLCVLNAFGDHPGLEQRADFFRIYAENNHVASVEILTQKTGMVRYRDIAVLKTTLNELVNTMLQLPDRPSGLFVPHDIQVALVYDLLYSRGVMPGKDIEIIGCDNDHMALAGLYPKPATIDILPSVLGRRAVQELIWKIENPSYRDSEDICVAVKPKLMTPDKVL